MALACGLFFGMCALFVELHALAVAILFMTKHTARLPFPCPIIVPVEYPRVLSLFEFFAGCSATN